MLLNLFIYDAYILSRSLFKNFLENSVVVTLYDLITSPGRSLVVQMHLWRLDYRGGRCGASICSKKKIIQEDVKT